MKEFKAFVTNKETGEKLTITSTYNSKKNFIKDLRNNGYKVNKNKVKESEVYDWIIKNTNCYPWDWTETTQETIKNQEP